MTLCRIAPAPKQPPPVGSSGPEPPSPDAACSRAERPSSSFAGEIRRCIDPGPI